MVRTRLRPPGGSSLLELLIVVGVVAILAGVAVLGMESMEGTASTTACNADARRLRQAQEAAKVLDGEYLTEAELVESDRLRVESDQFDMVVLRDDYRLLPVDDCIGLLPSQSVAEGEVGSVLSPLGDEVSREVPTTTAPPTGRCTRGQVDLNTATPDQLQRLAHVGPAEVDAIVAMRPVEDLWELAAVPGTTAEELAELLTQGLACI